MHCSRPYIGSLLKETRVAFSSFFFSPFFFSFSFFSAVITKAYTSVLML